MTGTDSAENRGKAPRRDPLGIGQAIWIRAAGRLLALLEKERRLLRSGALAEAAALAQEKERLAAEIAAPPASPGEEAKQLANRILRDATRNRMLLAACRDAVRAARERIEQINAARSSLGVYDALGSKQPAVSPGRTHDRRA